MIVWIILVVVLAVSEYGCSDNSGPTPPTPTISTTTASTAPSGTTMPCGRASGAESVPFYVYADAGDARNHFIPSGFFGDIMDLTLAQDDSSMPRTGSNAIRIEYRPRGDDGFAGIFWQCPEGNWGTVPNAGFNLTLATRVSFFAKVAESSMKAEFKVGGIGFNDGAPFKDSTRSISTEPSILPLDTEWRRFEIDLTPHTANLTYIIGGFMFVTSKEQNPNGLVLYLDEIVWE